MKYSVYISLIVPLYNEQRRLSRGLNMALKFLKKQNYKWELILVNDGSTDKTAAILKKYSNQKNISIITSKKNFGKGHAIRQGVNQAQGKYIFFSDIDFSVSPKFINLFVVKLKRYDIVIGSRRLKKSNIVKHQNSIRESLGQGFTKLSNLILGLNHSDLTCGFKGFKRQAAQQLFKRQRLNGWAFDSEILFIANKLRLDVQELPIDWHNDPLTKVSLLKDMFSSFLALFLIRYNNFLAKYQ